MVQFLQAWLESRRADGEKGEFAMEFAITSAVVLVAVVAALAAATPSIGTVINSAMTTISGLVP